jgi:hypothetical protein
MNQHKSNSKDIGGKSMLHRMEMVKKGRPWSFFAVIDDGLVAG